MNTRLLGYLSTVAAILVAGSGFVGVLAPSSPNDRVTGFLVLAVAALLLPQLWKGGRFGWKSRSVAIALLVVAAGALAGGSGRGGPEDEPLSARDQDAALELSESSDSTVSRAATGASRASGSLESLEGFPIRLVYDWTKQITGERTLVFVADSSVLRPELGDSIGRAIQRRLSSDPRADVFVYRNELAAKMKYDRRGCQDQYMSCELEVSREDAEFIRSNEAASYGKGSPNERSAFFVWQPTADQASRQIINYSSAPPPTQGTGSARRQLTDEERYNLRMIQMEWNVYCEDRGLSVESETCRLGLVRVTTEYYRKIGAW